MYRENSPVRTTILEYFGWNVRRKMRHVLILNLKTYPSDRRALTEK